MGTSFAGLLCCVLLIGFVREASSAGGGLKWVRVNVPQYRVPGETAMLQCDFDLGNDTLYAVKWYKEHEEFYRFVPKARPQAHSYNVEGVHVDISKSDSRKVVLHPVSWKSSGLYRCEVSAEAPSFASAQSEARMEVVCKSPPGEPCDHWRGDAVPDRRRDQPELHVGKKPSGVDPPLVHQRTADPETGGPDPVPVAPPSERPGVVDAGAALQAEQPPLQGRLDEGEVRGVHSAHTVPQRQGVCSADAEPAHQGYAGGPPTCEKFNE